MDVLVMGAIPPELRAAIGARHTLVADAPDLATPGRFHAALTTSAFGVSAAAMARLPALRLIACNGVGLDKIDLEEAASRGIRVVNTPDAVRTDTADMAIALLFATVRRVAEADRFVRAGEWTAARMTPSRRVTGMKAGIVGLGAIGALIAQRLTALGLDVAYTGPRQKPVPWPYIPDIAALAARSDVLILSCPGGPSTQGIVDARVLRQLGPESFLVNVARGSVVDEPALLDALETKAIAGAGLDVFVTEPALNPRFLPLQNTVLQPHYAAVTHQARAEMAATLLAAIDGFQPAEE